MGDVQARAAEVLAAQYEAFRREHAALGTVDSPEGFAARYAPGAAAALAEAGLLVGSRTDALWAELAAQRDAARAGLAEVKAERDGLAQAMWDGYVALGFDPDGDKGPRAWIAGARSHGKFARQWLAEVRHHRADVDEADEEGAKWHARAEQAEAREAALREGVRALADDQSRWIEATLNGQSVPMPAVWLADLHALLGDSDV